MSKHGGYKFVLKLNNSSNNNSNNNNTNCRNNITPNRFSGMQKDEP